MPLTWDKKASRYRDPKGKFIAEKVVRREITRTIEIIEKDMRKVSKQLAEAKISIPEWQTKMGDMIKTSHTLTGAVGGGGRAQMTAAKWGKVGAAVREQYKYLNNFAREAERGRLSVKQIEARGASYAKPLRVTFHNAEKDSKKDAGLTLAKRVLNAMESCAGCLWWAGKGFVPIDTLPTIGSLACRSNCRCEIVYG